MEKPESLDDESEESFFLFLTLFLLSCLLLLDLLYFMSSNGYYPLDDESDNDGSESGSSGTYSFPDFFCVLMISLVVLVAWGQFFLYEYELSPNVVFLSLSCSYQ